jgi:superfamily II DNA or RNA helicase
MLSLRRYQERALAALATAEAEGVRRPLVVHPTGTGKTVTFSHFIANRDALGRSLVFVHRDELAQQTVEKLGMIAPELETGIVKAEMNELDARVVIASVQTLARERRLAEVVEAAKRSPFGTLIVDEAHHAPAPTWRRALEALGAFNPYGPLTAGFTATPERDGKSLSVWEKVVDYMSIREAIYGDRKRGEEGGYLVPILPAQTIETKMDLGNVGKTGGDYNEGDLGEKLEDSGAIDQIADGILEHAKDRKGVAFTPTVRTAELLATALRRRGITAEALSGETPKQERRAILRRLKNGQTRWVANCGVLTEGFDEPSISCVCVARATKFHGLYVQMVGRGTRLYPGKENLLILDVVGASARHELISRVDLGDLPPDQIRKPKPDAEEQVCGACGGPCEDRAAHRCQLCDRQLPVKLIQEGERRHENCQHGRAEKVDVFGSSRLRWLTVEQAYCLGAGKGVLVMLPVGEDVWKLARYEQGRITVIHEALPADWARGVGEDHAKAFLSLNERNKRWLSEPPSQLQKTRLLNEGLPAKSLPKVQTKGQAADLMTRIQARRALRKLVG